MGAIQISLQDTEPGALHFRCSAGVAAALADLTLVESTSGPVNPSDYRLGGRYHHVRGIGGTTLHFTGEAHRLNPAAMRMHSRFGVAADWPLDYAELEPFYCEAERIIGVAGPHDNPVRTRSEPYPLPAHPLSYASRKIADGCHTLGFTWVPNSVASLSAPYDERPSCNYCANCNRGCPITDKGSVDVTFLRKALASGHCTIKSDCQVTQIEAGPSDRVAQVHYVDDTGNAQAIAGRVVIVACGAVETPRLLLASTNQHAPNGVGNKAGQVGRHFMETLVWTSSGLHSEPLDSFRGLPADSACWDFNAPDAIPNVIGGCYFSPATAEADLLGPINYAKRVVPGWGKAHQGGNAARLRSGAGAQSDRRVAPTRQLLHRSRSGPTGQIRRPVRPHS